MKVLGSRDRVISPIVIPIAETIQKKNLDIQTSFEKLEPDMKKELSAENYFACKSWGSLLVGYCNKRIGW